MKKAVYPGSFDPFSNGHFDIVKRASKLFDELHILVSYNLNKATNFTKDERVSMIKKCVKALPNVIVDSYDGLVVEYCKEHHIDVIVRGLRNYTDYENEFNLFQYNRDISPSIETVLFLPSTKNQFVSSSAIKELVRFNCDISKYVPKEIEKDIEEIFIKQS
ncbi:MAG: pantetheine-phosphate adenylyltransferase [Roseburia sp.]|nr:pantetheine-phosphate adenylyltransferase [Anaeroplasma bactoclasticum]MCM1195864.1 pantetheine-phosphate adenylyltransferase [Roseburia sp.]MCM1556548.1 pantetheine-phosphate adenylyltransferase [Anaeroplasma bactoclasticum]